MIAQVHAFLPWSAADGALRSAKRLLFIPLMPNDQQESHMLLAAMLLPTLTTVIDSASTIVSQNRTFGAVLGMGSDDEEEEEGDDEK
jgi:hypothetical protein